MNKNYNISELEQYQTLEYLLKYLKNELSEDNNEKIEFLLETNSEFSDMLDGLLFLENPDDIIETKNELNKKIDTFTKNIKKQQTYKYLKIRNIVTFILMISLIVFSILTARSVMKIYDYSKLKYDESGYLITDNYNKILYLSDNKRFIKDIVIKPQKEIIIEKYIVTESIIKEKNINNKFLKKNNNFDFFEEDYYLENNINYKSAEYEQGDNKFNKLLIDQLIKLPKIKSLIVILTISDSGVLNDIYIYENNFPELNNEIEKIFSDFKNWKAAKVSERKIESKIAIFTSSR